MKSQSVTVLFYGVGGVVVVREHTYATLKAAYAARERAVKRGQISAIKGTRKAGDPPTVHH